jgi:hypothetical protein
MSFEAIKRHIYNMAVTKSQSFAKIKINHDLYELSKNPTTLCLNEIKLLKHAAYKYL